MTNFVQGVQGFVQGFVQGKSFARVGMCRVCRGNARAYAYKLKNILSIYKTHTRARIYTQTPAHPAQRSHSAGLPLHIPLHIPLHTLHIAGTHSFITKKNKK